MDEFETWIEQAISSAAIKNVRHISGQEAIELFRTVATRYSLDGEPVRLWESPVRPLLIFDIKTVKLVTLIQQFAGGCWFVPETGRHMKPAFWLETKDVPVLLEACTVTMTYYIFGLQQDWLVMESDHQQYLVFGSAISEELKTIGHFYP